MNCLCVSLGSFVPAHVNLQRDKKHLFLQLAITSTVNSAQLLLNSHEETVKQRVLFLLTLYYFL